MSPAGPLAFLDPARTAFRGALADAGADATIGAFNGRIGLVLSGGGARGAYEAGALLAFQDAGLPTHIIAATSIGSINAASYAARSATHVGSAEKLAAAWIALTPGTLGIEWSRYAWMAAGLIATSAGLGNLAYYLLTLAGLHVDLHRPALAWSSLALAGLALLLFHPQLPYIWFLLRSRLRRRPLEPEPRRLAASVAANLLVGLFLVSVTLGLELHTTFTTQLRRHPLSVAGVLLLLWALAVLQVRLRRPLGRGWERLIRLVLHPGLFNNFERTRYLRAHIPIPAVRYSPMRLIFTATDLGSGRPRYYSNTPAERLAADRGANAAFVGKRVQAPEDLMPAIIASSALPITYEPLTLAGRQLADGAVVGSQPIQPALHLGADVLFLVLLEPPERPRREASTFVDVGTRALSILMHEHLRADLRVHGEVNRLCEEAARGLGEAPEAVAIELGRRRFRYVRAFVIQPDAPLGLGILDFGGAGTGEAIRAGYRDAARQITEFLPYARTARFDHERRVLRLMPSDFALGWTGRHT